MMDNKSYHKMWPEGQAGVEIKVDGFSHKLPLLVDYFFQPQSACSAGGAHIHHTASAKTKNPKEGNSVVELYVQTGTDDLAKRSMLDMVDQVLHEPCYDTLRTKHQLGYSVHSGFRLTHGILGFAVCVVSGTHDPVTLQERIEAFLDSSTFLLADLPPEDFERHRQALIAAKLQQCHSLLMSRTHPYFRRGVLDALKRL
ncbi:hypothetical protein ABBQ38_011279 [Trebouxia sp. C0009 RCD-2024]